MKPSQLRNRTRRFAVEVIRLAQRLPSSPAAQAVQGPLLRAGTAVGAAYRGACRARNRYDFMARLQSVEEASDETTYWLELILETALVKADQVQPLLDEAKQLGRILTKSRRVATRHFAAAEEARDDMEDDIPF